MWVGRVESPITNNDPKKIKQWYNRSRSSRSLFLKNCPSFPAGELTDPNLDTLQKYRHRYSRAEHFGLLRCMMPFYILHKRDANESPELPAFLIFPLAVCVLKQTIE